MQERRKQKRLPISADAFLTILIPDQTFSPNTVRSVATDISRSGMGCYADRPFYPGQRIVLCLPLSGQQGRRNVYATVVRCRQGDDGYRVGLEFDNASLGARYGSTAVAAA